MFWSADAGYRFQSSTSTINIIISLCLGLPTQKLFLKIGNLAGDFILERLNFSWSGAQDLSSDDDGRVTKVRSAMIPTLFDSTQRRDSALDRYKATTNDNGLLLIYVTPYIVFSVARTEVVEHDAGKSYNQLPDIFPNLTKQRQAASY